MDYLSGHCRSTARLDQKTVIITGANTGIGKETAKNLYIRGANVILACRNTEKALQAMKEIELESQNGGRLSCLKLDVSCIASIKEFVQIIEKTEENVNILINNAGVMACPEERTVDGFEKQMGTNHLGPFLLTLLLLPKMIKSGASRIICVSSMLHEKFPVDIDDLNFTKKPYSAYEAYCRSKSANIMFARELAKRLKAHAINNVTTYSLHPGVVNTELSRHFSTTYMNGLTWLWNNILSWFMKSAKCGAQTTIYCAVEVRCQYESGLYYSDCVLKTPSTHTQDEENCSKLWDESIKMLGLQNYDPFQQ